MDPELAEAIETLDRVLGDEADDLSPYQVVSKLVAIMNDDSNGHGPRQGCSPSPTVRALEAHLCTFSSWGY